MKIAHITFLDQYPVDLWAHIHKSNRSEQAWAIAAIGDWKLRPPASNGRLYLSRVMQDFWVEYAPEDIPPDIWAQLLAAMMTGEQP